MDFQGFYRTDLPNQTAFIARRSISDNTLLADEMVHVLIGKEHEKGGLSIDQKPCSQLYI